MRDVAIVAFAQSDQERRIEDRNEVELLSPVIQDIYDQTGMNAADFGFTCSGSTDYLAGQAFSFVITLDSVGPWPPISESHVEMDGAWALYEAWVKIQTGAIDTALVYAYGKSSPGDLRAVLSRQMDPYYVAPLWADSVGLAALQAQAVLDAGLATERDWAEVAARSRICRRGQPSRPAARLARCRRPARRRLRRRPAPPARLPTDHRRRRRHRPRRRRHGHISSPIDRPGSVASTIGSTPRTSASVISRCLRRPTIAAERAGVGTRAGRLRRDSTRRSPTRRRIVRRAMGLADDVVVNPSGGALAANAMMTAGLIRFGEAATRISRGDGDRAVAHATSGACLQQNIVAVLEGE